MKIKESGLVGKVLDLAELDLLMGEHGFDRWAWDYHRATYDYKYEDRQTGDIYYLRVPAVAVEGIIEETNSDAVLELKEPYIGRHIYPHGFDYDAAFPEHIVKHARQTLQSLTDHLQRVE